MSSRDHKLDPKPAKEASAHDKRYIRRIVTEKTMAVSGVSIGDKLIIKAGGPAVHLLRVSSQHLTLPLSLRLCRSE
jgi:hypothetical protein